LRCVPRLWFRGVLPVVVCWWRFRLVRVLVALPRPRPFVVAVRVRGVLLPWRLVWVARFWWLFLLVRFLLRLRWLAVSASLVLRLAVARCGCPFPAAAWLALFSWRCFSCLYFLCFFAKFYVLTFSFYFFSKFLFRW